MLLTITATSAPTADGDGWPATDLGYLLHKHPGRVQSFDVSAGVAHVFYPEATAGRCTVALLLEVDPVRLVRGERADDSSLGQYINDRPYAASSMLAVALARVFRTAMSGRCDAKPELAARAIPVQIYLPVLPCRGGSDLAARLFEPLGWQVRAEPIALDERFPAWGESHYLDVLLSGDLRLADALHHLYVLLPVLDDAKHYWVGPDEVDKLIQAGGGWLAGHPWRTLIARRYLAHRTGLYRSALARLAEVDDADPDSLDNAVQLPCQEPDMALARYPEPGAYSGQVAGSMTTDPGPSIGAATAPVAQRAGSAGSAATESLAKQRRAAVLAVLLDAGVQRVADVGCGEGALAEALLADPRFTEVIAADVSSRALEVAERRLRPDRMPERQRARLRIIQSSLTYRDQRLTGLDAVVLVEVIEHVDQARLGALERTVFTFAAPGLVIVTTPNSEYNVRYGHLAPGVMRHHDHRFEWTRARFASWAGRVAAEFGYTVRFRSVGDDDPEFGSPTQMAVFTRAGPVPPASGGRGSAGGRLAVAQ